MADAMSDETLATIRRAWDGVDSTASQITVTNSSTPGQLLHALSCAPRDVRRLLDEVDRLKGVVQRRTQEWQDEQAARAKAEQATITADERARQAEAELDAIRTRDETVGGVLYDVVRRCQTGELDEHQAVRAIDARLIHPLVAKLQEARAKASRGAGRRRTGAAQLGSVRAERGRLAQLVRDLTDPDPCYFDHHGGCQAHGYLSLKPGEKCPHAEAKELRHEAHIARTRAPRKERP